MARELGRKVVATNRRANYDYQILEVFEAGLVLSGTEVKSLREGKASLVDGYALIEGGEAWLENVHIPEFSNGSWTNHASRRRRKLLLRKVEINRLVSQTREAGFTLIPISLYFNNGRVKIEIARARGKRQYDKRQALIEAQETREAKRSLSAHRKFSEI